MSHAKSAREEAEAPGAGAAAAAAAPAAASLTHDDTLLVLGIVAQTLARCMHTSGDDVKAARGASASARRPFDAGCRRGCLP